MERCSIRTRWPYFRFSLRTRSQVMRLIFFILLNSLELSSHSFFSDSFCIEPASVAPFEWPDDITKWPKCRKKLPGLGKNWSRYAPSDSASFICCFFFMSVCFLLLQDQSQNPIWTTLLRRAAKPNTWFAKWSVTLVVLVSCAKTPYLTS